MAMTQSQIPGDLFGSDKFNLIYKELVERLIDAQVTLDEFIGAFAIEEYQSPLDHPNHKRLGRSTISCQGRTFKYDMEDSGWGTDIHRQRAALKELIHMAKALRATVELVNE